MNKNRKAKVNYNIYVEKENDFYHSLIVRVVKKGLDERKDLFMYLSKNNQSTDEVYFNIINHFVSQNIRTVKDEISGINVIMPHSSSLELLKSKYKNIDPFASDQLKGIEEVYLQSREHIKKLKEENIQVQYVVIEKDEKNKEISEIEYRLKNEKFLKNHFYSAQNSEMKKRLLKTKNEVILGDDNQLLDIYVMLKNTSNENEFEFCCTTIKKNKYDQPKNYYYSLKISAMSKENALISSVAKFYTENKAFTKLLNNCVELNIYSNKENSSRLNELFSGILNNNTMIMSHQALPEKIEKAMNNYIRKNNYRLEKENYKKTIKYEELKNKKDTMIIYTDGSVKDKTALSCFGAVFRMPNSDYVLYEMFGNTDEEASKNQIDFIENKGIESALNFVIEKLKSGKLRSNFNIEIRCDSFNNIREINKALSGNCDLENPIWKEKVLKVVGLVKELKTNVSFMWVKGHYKDPYNIQADKLAKMGYLAQKNKIEIYHSDEELEIKLRNKQVPLAKRKIKMS